MLDQGLNWIDGKAIVNVPPGFVCDLGSIPRLLWWWAAPDGVYRSAVIIHDWLYRQQTTTRREADAIMYRVMRHVGVRPTQAWLMWAGVRLGGWIGWRQNSYLQG